MMILGLFTDRVSMRVGATLVVTMFALTLVFLTWHSVGVWRSADRGASWTKGADAVGGGTGPHYYQELWASPHAFDRLYLAGVRIQVSDDGGKTFRQLKESRKHSDNHAVAFRADEPDYLMVGSDGGLYESHDLAETWRFIQNLPVTQFYKIALDDDQPFYNVGVNWTHVFGPSVINEVLAGYSRTTVVSETYDWAGIGAANGSYGIAGGQPIDGLSCITSAAGACAGLNGLSPLGIIATDSDTLAKTYQLNEKLTWLTGRHTLKFGGQILHWVLATMKQAGTVASIGNAASFNINTTVFPFILRGVSLLGVDSGYMGFPTRQRVWDRLATDLKPRHLAGITRTIAFEELPAAFDDFIHGRVKGRTVVRIGA